MLLSTCASNNRRISMDTAGIVLHMDMFPSLDDDNSRRFANMNEYAMEKISIWFPFSKRLDYTEFAKECSEYIANVSPEQLQVGIRRKDPGAMVEMGLRYVAQVTSISLLDVIPLFYSSPSRLCAPVAIS